MSAFQRSRTDFIAHRARGAVLFVALVFLVLLTLIAITASSTSILQERMVGGMRNGHLAMGGAESALREGETRLFGAGDSGTFALCGTQGLFNCYSFTANVPITTVNNFRNSTAWVSAGAQTYNTKDLTALGSGSESGNLSKQPVYIIEDLGIEQPPGAGGLQQLGNDGDKGGGGGGGSAVTKHLYRLTARSTSGSDAVMRMAESTFASKSN
jgi:type IV pilus assembly protein PilX